ncbi:MAG: DUF5305 domain-containing protein [Chloroflexi bacterium]|nr:DUF5305 domain-containing protein [Chloroflexota bacterium]
MKRFVNRKMSRIDWSTFGKPVPRNIRIPVIVSLFIGVVVSSIFLFDNESSESATTLTAIPIFTYEHEAALTYQVHLKPNIVYETSTPQPGQTYFTKLIDYIDVYASYEFSADTPTQNSGDYGITIYLEANNMPGKSFPVSLDVPDPDLTFEHTAELDYQVHLKPNIFYTTTTLGPGETYFSNIVDHFDVTASYSFNCDSPSQSSGQYEVTGILAAPPYWQKSYVIHPQAPFDAGEKTHTVSNLFTIDLDEYRLRADEINAELGVHPRETDLTIQLNVQLDAKTDNGSITEHLSPSMRIPLSAAQFTIDGDLSQTSAGYVSGKGSGILRPQFASDGKVANFNDGFRIDLTPYQDILDTIADQTGIVLQEPRLVVVLDVNITAESDKGTVVKNLNPSMIIPLSPKTTEITGEFSDAQSGSIDKKGLETRSTSSGNNSGPITSLIIFSILFVGFTGLTRNKPETANPFLKRMNSINKKYRARLVEVTHMPDITDQQIISMASVEDLDRIAEEIMKPIIYHRPNSPDGPHIYCVLDGTIRYQYVLSKESIE